MLQRIFIAINFPDAVKDEFLSFQEKWPELPIRWAKKENIHITLAFLGNTSERELPEVLRIAKETAENHSPFEIQLTRIIYGPPKTTPRMIWITGEKSEELLSLQKDLEEKLASSKILHFIPEKREFTLHLTLGRLREWEFQRIEPEERPEVNEEISMTVPVNSIEIMESKLKRGGTEYTILQSFALKMSNA